MATLSFFFLFPLFFLPVFPFLPPPPPDHCPKISCGQLGNISYPFTNKTTTDECGPFAVDHCNEGIPKIRLWRDSEKSYDILSVSKPQSHYINEISITDTELQKNLNSHKCESFNWNLYLPGLPNSPSPSFHITSNFKTLYKCNRSANSANHDFVFDFDSDSNFSSYKNCPHFNIYYYTRNDYVSLSPGFLQPYCSVMQLPVNTKYSDAGNIFRMFTATNFSLQVSTDPKCCDCHQHGGKCNVKSNGEFGYCTYAPRQLEVRPECHECPVGGGQCHYNSSGYHCVPPPYRKKSHKGLGLKLGIGVGVTAVLLIILVLGIFFLSKISIFYWKRNTHDHRSIESFLSKHGLMAPKRYRYKEVKKMTESFNEKLGQGGYGSVFKGKLSDGHLVAVKVLKESKSNGEEFINEVASISRTSHVNIVTLLGFCFEGSKRALIYEFMSNGSLEKYIYEENPLNNVRQLDWETSYQIAVDIARGLEYLHRGCNTRILHFDIKPHNILLDENFCPKISDFGLAKICTRQESVISMLGARGTVGYIAPEVFCRNFGRVSHKSDVYSYGMLVLDMVGGRRNIRVSIDHTSEIYFPHWIFKRLKRGEQLGLHGIDNDEENQISRKMLLVSLWCIQTDPSNRPPMSRVVEMLQGDLESLTIPPEPYLSSPSRSPPRSEVSSSTIGTTTTL